MLLAIMEITKANAEIQKSLLEARAAEKEEEVGKEEEDVVRNYPKDVKGKPLKKVCELWQENPWKLDFDPEHLKKITKDVEENIQFLSMHEEFFAALQQKGNEKYFQRYKALKSPLMAMKNIGNVLWEYADMVIREQQREQRDEKLRDLILVVWMEMTKLEETFIDIAREAAGLTKKSKWDAYTTDEDRKDLEAVRMLKLIEAVGQRGQYSNRRGRGRGRGRGGYRGRRRGSPPDQQ